MRWFGASWKAPVCETLQQVPVPVEERCFHCEGDFIEHDRGFVLPFESPTGTRDTFWHYVCLIKAIT